MLCRCALIHKVQPLNIHEFNEIISNERHVEEVKTVPSKLRRYQLLTITDYQTWYQINAKTKRSYPNGQIFQSHNLHIHEFNEII